MRPFLKPLLWLMLVGLLSVGCGGSAREQIGNPLPDLQPAAAVPEATPVIEESSAPASAEVEDAEQGMETPTAVAPPAEPSPHPSTAPAGGLDPTIEAQAAALENLLDGLIQQNEEADSLDDLP